MYIYEIRSVSTVVPIDCCWAALSLEVITKHEIILHECLVQFSTKYYTTILISFKVH